ncbi:hypothetical protein FRX31_011138 [Thalictrum thalictroides]|nr:hypothetical protein FRX31_011138 [Thalictrum thalictroides]
MCEKVYPPLLDSDTKDNPILMEMDKPGKKKQVPKDFPSLKLMKNTAKVKNPLQLVVQMQRSHFKYRTLLVSAPFGRKSGLVKMAKSAKETNKSYMITIKDPNGKPWKLQLNYKPSANIAFFGRGWTEFLKANKLKVGDVCTFKLVSMAPKKTIMEMTVSKRKSSSLKAKFAR